MMNRALLLSLLIYGLFFTALITRAGGLIALTIPLVIYLGAAILHRPDITRLKATRTLSAGLVSPAEPVTVRLLLTNQGNPLEEVLLEDLLPASLTLMDGHTNLMTCLAAGATVELKYRLSGPRGAYSFPGVRVIAKDRFGLFQKQEIVAAPGDLLVLPEVIKLRRVAIRPRQTRVYSGIIPARQGGAGVEFFGVREYQPGDPLRWINSRASARHPQTLFINEFEQERVADVGLILDARQQSDARTPAGTLFEHSIQATAALADVFLNTGNRVGLFIYGRSLDWTYPGYGKVQRVRILRALARAEPGGGHIFEKLEHLPTRLFPAKSQLVLISPLLSGDEELLIRLRARGYRLLVVSPDPIAFEVQGLAEPAMPAVKLATRLARLERELLLAKLRQADIRVVAWTVDTPFEYAANAILSRFQRL
jgi:uncharacterized protein (DUF58 family)